MAWENLTVTPPPRVLSEPRLRIFNRRNGYLNASARAILFGERGEGRVLIQCDGPRVSIVAAEEGLKVGRLGRVTVTPLTAHFPAAPIPVTLRMRASSAEDEANRLVITGAV